jgi:hypothetical protein
MTTEQIAPAESYQTPADLRAAYDRLKTRVVELEAANGTLEGDLKGFRITEAGFPKGSPGYNVLADHYDGDLSAVEAVREFAAKYGHEPAAAPATPAPEGGPPAGAIEAEAVRADRREAVATPATPAGGGGRREQLAAEIAEMEANPSPETAVRLVSLKSELYRLTVER